MMYVIKLLNKYGKNVPKARKDLARLVKEYLKAQGDEGLDRSYKG